jgi:hypothetical protein
MATSVASSTDLAEQEPPPKGWLLFVRVIIRVKIILTKLKQFGTICRAAPEYASQGSPGISKDHLESQKSAVLWTDVAL